MCETPCKLPDGQLVACRYCWQCRNDRVDDLVGRCIAESRSATTTYAVTLTYGGGDRPEAAVLEYSGFQRMMKRLRKAGYKVRYIVAGEYGSEKGRAHWHAILFFYGKGPEVVLEERIDWKYWPEGFAFFERPEYGAFRYCLKYVLKNQKLEVSAKYLAMSKKPLLGESWILSKADEYVAAGIPPQNYEYWFPEAYHKSGKLRVFRLQGKAREVFCERFLSAWWAKYPDKEPHSPIIDEYRDQLVRKANELGFEGDLSLRKALMEKAVGSWTIDTSIPIVKAVSGYDLRGQVVKNSLGFYNYIRFNEEGEKLWQRRIAGRAEIRSALLGTLPRTRQRQSATVHQLPKRGQSGVNIMSAPRRSTA